MEFPFGHHQHHHHHRPEEDSNPNPNQYPNPNSSRPPGSDPLEYQPPPPPPGSCFSSVPMEYGRPEYHPPPNIEHVSHEYGRPDFAPPPPVHHVSHEARPGSGYGFEDPEQQQQHHHRPGFFPSTTPHVEPIRHENRLGDLLRQPTVRIFTKANEDFSLSIRDGKVVLVPADPSDPYQHWIKDLKYSTRVKDQEGLPSFALVNKATGEAIKYAAGATHPVQLVPYNHDYPDEVLWTESYDTGEGFRCIRMATNIGLNFDAFNGDEDHGGVRDGTTVVLWEWLKGKNQMWKIVPYCKFLHTGF